MKRQILSAQTYCLEFAYAGGICIMKATGIVRRIDDLGRVVIPKEIRRTLRLRDGDPMEIFTDREGTVILKKYSPIGDISDIAEEFAESAGRILGSTAVITDRDQVVAVSGGAVRDLLEKQISDRLAGLLEEKNSILITEGSDVCRITGDDGYSESCRSQIVVPIISQGDLIGSVILVSSDSVMGDTELKTAQVGAAFIAKQMELS